MKCTHTFLYKMYRPTRAPLEGYKNNIPFVFWLVLLKPWGGCSKIQGIGFCYNHLEVSTKQVKIQMGCYLQYFAWYCTMHVWRRAMKIKFPFEVYLFCLWAHNYHFCVFIFANFCVCPHSSLSGSRIPVFSEFYAVKVFLWATYMPVHA